MSDKKLWEQYVAMEKERDALRAKITEMERQEPVAWMLNCPTLGGDIGWILSWTQSGAGLCNRLQGEENEKRLYALPCAQPETRSPDGWKLVPIEPTPMMKTAGIGVEVYQDSPPSSDCLTWEEAEAIYTAMLAAAPEAKP